MTIGYVFLNGKGSFNCLFPLRVPLLFDKFTIEVVYKYYSIPTNVVDYVIVPHYVVLSDVSWSD